MKRPEKTSPDAKDLHKDFDMKLFFKITGIILIIGCILLVSAIIGGYIFLKNVDIKKYKPRIVQIATRAIGRPVDFEDITLKVSLEEGIRLHVLGLSIAESPEFGAGRFAFIQEVNAGVDILSFLVSRQISVPGILVRSPEINVVRNTIGTLNVQTIGRPPREASSPEKHASSPSPAAALPVIFVNSFKIENARIVFIDQSVVPELKLAVTQLTLDVRRFSLTNPFDVLLEAAALSSQKNFQLSGKIQLKLLNNEVKFSDTQATFDLDRLPLEQLKTSLFLKDVPLPRVLEGQVKIKIKEGVVSDKGLGKLNADVSLVNAKVIAPEIVPGISVEADDAQLAIDNFTLDGSAPAKIIVKAALYQNRTNIDFTGQASFDLKTMEGRLTDGQFVTDLSLWPLDKIKAAVAPLKDVPLPEHLSGVFQTVIKEATVTASGLKTILLDAFLTGGEIALNDIVPGLPLELSKTDAKITNFSLAEPFSVSLKTAYLSETPNIFLDGKMALDLAAQNIYVKSMVIKTDLGTIPLERLKTVIAPLKDAPLPEILKGQVDIQVKDLSAGPKGLMSVAVDAALKDGEISIKDVAPGISLAASHISMEVKDFGLGRPFGFDVHLAYLSDKPNIHTQGTAVVQLEDQSVALKDTGVRVDFSAVSMEQLKSSVAALKDVSLPEYLKGDLNIAIAEALAGPKGLSALSSEVALKNWEVKLKELVVPVSGRDARFNVTEDSFAGGPLQIALGSGQITARIGVLDYMTRQDFDFAAEMTNINPAEILDQKDAPVKVEGLIVGSIKAKGRAADIHSITGNASFEVKEAKLKDLNVLKMVLDKISFLPDAASRVEAKLPPKYKEKLKDTDTEIKKASAAGVISNGAMIFDPISVEADEFTFLGKCQAGFDQKYSLDGAVKIPTELSAIMAEGVVEFQYLYDKDSNISLPVHVAGQGARVPVVSVTQTAVDMGKNVMRSQGKKELEKIFHKVLGVPRQPADSATQDQPQGPPTEEQKSPESQIIDNILDSIFR